MFGSGMPILAATVISRASLEKTLERIASCFPFLCMMFLNWLWPAIGVCSARKKWKSGAVYALKGVR